MNNFKIPTYCTPGFTRSERVSPVY